MIYPSDAKQISLPITNSDEKTMFLVRSWVADADGKKINDFIVTPPLFVLNPQKESSLRVMFVGTQDPTIQQERVYYFHSQAIPSLPEEAKEYAPNRNKECD
ncbi:Chaperone protein FimC precursor [compost metagenome]